MMPSKGNKFLWTSAFQNPLVHTDFRMQFQVLAKDMHI